jgi:hypothetical protein
MTYEPHGARPTIRKCGAHARSSGRPCEAPAMRNGRCRFHGGKSTGPRTPEGLERSKRANWKHTGAIQRKPSKSVAKRAWHCS